MDAGSGPQTPGLLKLLLMSPQRYLHHTTDLTVEAEDAGHDGVDEEGAKGETMGLPASLNSHHSEDVDELKTLLKQKVLLLENRLRSQRNNELSFSLRIFSTFPVKDKNHRERIKLFGRELRSVVLE